MQRALPEVVEEGGNNNPEPDVDITAVFALVLTTLRHYRTLEKLLEQPELLPNERIDARIARGLITESLWGKGLPLVPSQPQDVPNNKVKRVQYVRVNTLKSSVEEAIDHFIKGGWQKPPTPDTYEEFLELTQNLDRKQFVRDFHVPELLVFDPDTELNNDNLYDDGTVLLQDKSSCIAAHVLAPPPGSVVMHMCADNGKTTTHLAALMNNSGKIYAVEKNAAQYTRLNAHVEACDACCVTTFNEGVLQLEPENFLDVEYILLDAPNSGSGIVDEYGDTRKTSSNAEHLQSLNRVQIQLLKFALKKFPALKRIVYSTCSLHTQENEDVIKHVLRYVRYPTYALVDPGGSLKEGLSGGSDDYAFSANCISLKPKKDRTNGFFIAVLERSVVADSCDKKKRGKRKSSWRSVAGNKKRRRATKKDDSRDYRTV